MRDYKSSFRLLVILTSSAALAVCPLTASTFVGLGASAEGLGQPIDFTPNVKQLELTSVAAPSPMPTLGPGQFLDEGDPRLPAEIRIEKGDEQFGYGPWNDEQTEYLMWYTDDDGTHYRVVDSTSQILFGTVDPITGERRDNGFDKKVEERESRKVELSDLNVALRGEERAFDKSVKFSAILLGVGLGICIFASAGLCTLATPILAAGAVAGMTFGVQISSDHATISDFIDAKKTEIETVENDLRFDLSKPEPPLPDS